MNYENIYIELKEHCKHCRDVGNNGKSPASNIIRHVYQDVLNKMYQLEKKK